jgi:hypothetical protein
MKMRRTASEVIRSLEMRVARLEKQATPQRRSASGDFTVQSLNVGKPYAIVNGKKSPLKDANGYMKRPLSIAKKSGGNLPPNVFQELLSSAVEAAYYQYEGAGWTNPKASDVEFLPGGAKVICGNVVVLIPVSAVTAGSLTTESFPGSYTRTLMSNSGKYVESIMARYR